jgi:hypothetical protein
MRIHFHSLALMILLLWLTSACSQMSGRAGAGGGQKGYLAVDDKNIVFVQWTEVDKKLSGRLQVVYLKNGRRLQAESNEASFIGVTDGENISLNFTGNVWLSPLSGKTWTGTLKGDELILVIPLNNGVLAPVKFRYATVDDYNKAVAGLAKNTEAQNAQTQKEREGREALASEQQAVKNAIERVNEMASSLSNAVNALKDVDYEDVLNGYSEHLNDMRSHYQEVKDEAAERPMTNYQLSKVRYALSRVDYDMSRINYDSDRMKYVTNNQQGKISRVREAMSALQEAWNTLQGAAARNSTGTPSVPFTEEEIAQNIRQAEVEINTALSALRNASGKATAFEKQAKQLRNEATSFVSRIKTTDN